MDTLMAPIPMASAGTSVMPGRCEAMMPTAAPMNMPGNTGPPRNALSDKPYAIALHTTSSTRAPIVHVDACSTSTGSAD